MVENVVENLISAVKQNRTDIVRSITSVLNERKFCYQILMKFLLLLHVSNQK